MGRSSDLLCAWDIFKILYEETFWCQSHEILFINTNHFTIPTPELNHHFVAWPVYLSPPPPAATSATFPAWAFSQLLKFLSWPLHPFWRVKPEWVPMGLGIWNQNQEHYWFLISLTGLETSLVSSIWLSSSDSLSNNNDSGMGAWPTLHTVNRDAKNSYGVSASFPASFSCLVILGHPEA